MLLSEYLNLYYRLKYILETMKKAKTLDDHQLKRLLILTENSNNGLRNKTILTLSFYCGLRAKELAGLKVGDIINDNLNIKPEVELYKTKNDKHRTLYLSNTTVIKVLNDYLKSIETLILNDPLFKSQKGFHFSANSMSQLMKNLFKNAGSEFEGCSSHSGRRTLITKVVNSGVSLNKVKEIAGHSSISTTLEYVDTNPSDLSEIMKNL